MNGTKKTLGKNGATLLALNGKSIMTGGGNHTTTERGCHHRNIDFDRSILNYYKDNKFLRGLIIIYYNLKIDINLKFLKIKQKVVH